MYEALVSFATKIISMFKGQVAEIDDPEIVEDLLAANYIEAYSPRPSGGGFDVIIKLEVSIDEGNVASVDSYEIVGSTFAEIYAKLKNDEPVSGCLIEHETLIMEENATFRWNGPFWFNVDPYSWDAQTTLTNTIVFYSFSGIAFKWTAEGVDIYYV